MLLLTWPGAHAHLGQWVCGGTVRSVHHPRLSNGSHFPRNEHYSIEIQLTSSSRNDNSKHGILLPHWIVTD